MPTRRTNQEPAPLLGPNAAESVARNPHGQSLDEARAAFRAEWQTKIERKQAQAVKARKLEKWYRQAPRRILIGGAVVGACLGALGGALQGILHDFLLGALLGGAYGFLTVLPLPLLTLLGQWCHYEHAELLEREVRELKRS